MQSKIIEQLTDSSIDLSRSTLSEYSRSSEVIGGQYLIPDAGIDGICDTTGENRLGD